MKPVEPQLPVELNPPPPSDAAPKDVRSHGDRFDALLAKAEQTNKRADASAKQAEPTDKRTDTNVRSDDASTTATDAPGIELPQPGRSIHSSITRNVRPVSVRAQSADVLTQTAAATADVTASSAKDVDGDRVAGAKHGVQKTQPQDGDGDAQALQAVLGQVATVVARIEVPKSPADGQTQAVSAAGMRNAAPANDVAVPQPRAAAADAALPEASGARLDVPAPAGATAAADAASGPTVVPRARTHGTLAETAAEGPMAKARAANVRATAAATSVGTTQGATVSASAGASGPAATQEVRAPAQTADSPAAAAARVPAQSADTPAEARAPAQPAAPAGAAGVPAQSADTQAGAADAQRPATPAKPPPRADQRPALPALATVGLTPVSPTPLAVNASALSAREDTDSWPESRVLDKGKGAVVDDRIQGFTRGALGGPRAAYVGRVSAADAVASDSTPSKHAQALDEEEDHDSKVQASNTFDVLPQVLPDPTVNQQLAPPSAEPARMQAAIPQPPAPTHTAAAPMVQVEFAARPEGAQNEAASISIHHPDLGPIQLEVHRDQGRVEVHAVIESQHAEAVLRANENGIRQGVQQSGMAFSALKVRVRNEESSSARAAQPRRRRANDRE